MSSNNPRQDIEEYLQSKGVNEILKGLLLAITKSKPENVKQFTVDYFLSKYPGEVSIAASTAAIASNFEEKAIDASEASSPLPSAKSTATNSSLLEQQPSSPNSPTSPSTFLAAVDSIPSTTNLDFSTKSSDINDDNNDGDNDDDNDDNDDDNNDNNDNNDNEAEKEEEAFGDIGPLKTDAGVLKNFKMPENILRRGSMRRGGVSAEALSAMQETLHKADQSKEDRKVVPKTDEQKSQLNKAIEGNILFAHLDDAQKQEIFDAMFPVNFSAGATIIKQDDDGDNFYVLSEGKAVITVDREDNIVARPGPGDSFGELALIYNAPRAATVKAETDVVCWAIDRITYRRVLMQTTTERRKKYEGFLKNVPILEPLTQWERMVVADALIPVSFAKDEDIVKQGDPGDEFFIIVEGEVSIIRKEEGEEEKILSKLVPSNMFGEIALLTDRPRQATVRARTDVVKCVKLDRQAFNRVLGPCEEILKRNMSTYFQYVSTKI